jgi:thiamine transport system ATP-binding protein
MAVMRDGQVVQSGTLEEVWRSPADGETAAFLGYATVLHGSAAAGVLDAVGETAASGSVIALRRSALRVDPHGRLAGRVLSAKVTPDVLRLTVDVDGVGEVHAVADPHAEIRVGHLVRLRVQRDRAAILPPA